MKTKNTTYTVLSGLIQGLSEKVGSGAMFSSITEARSIAGVCKKSKQPLVESHDTAVVLGASKAVYSMIDSKHILFVIHNETACVELLMDSPIDASWCAYRMNGYQWQWAARGYGLTMMLKYMSKMGIDCIEFQSDVVYGIKKGSVVCGLSTITEHDPSKMTFMPKLVEPKPEPKVEVIELPKDETATSEQPVQKVQKKRLSKTLVTETMVETENIDNTAPKKRVRLSR